MIQDMMRDIRRKRRLTQARLGQLSGVPRVNIVRVENGKRELKLSEAIRIAAILGVSVESLTGEEVVETPEDGNRLSANS